MKSTGERIRAKVEKEAQILKKLEKGRLEKFVLVGCMRVLKQHNAFCWWQNTGAFRVDNRFFRSSIAGVSDIIGVLSDGRFIAVECKRENGGIISPRQHQFLQSVRECNGFALVIHDEKQLEIFLKLHGY